MTTKSLDLDIDWGSEPRSRCTATTVQLPFDLSADLAVIYQGQNDSGITTFSYRVEVLDMADQYGQGVPVWTKYSKPKYLTHVRAQLEATVALLEWFGKNVLAFDPNTEDGVSCRGYNVGRSEPEDGDDLGQCISCGQVFAGSVWSPAGDVCNDCLADPNIGGLQYGLRGRSGRVWYIEAYWDSIHAEPDFPPNH